MAFWEIITGVASFLAVLLGGGIFALIWRLHSQQMQALEEQRDALALFTSSHIMQEYEAMKKGLELALARKEQQLRQAKEISETEKKQLESTIADLGSALEKVTQEAESIRRCISVAPEVTAKYGLPGFVTPALTAALVEGLMHLLPREPRQQHD